MEKWSKSPWLLAVLCLGGGHSAYAETLEDALGDAYRNNPALVGARDMSSAADEGVNHAHAAYGPSLSLSVQHEYTDARIRGGVFPVHDEGFGTTGELALSQPLFTSGRLSAAVDAATANKFAVRARLEEASQRTIADVVTAYVFLQRDMELNGVAAEIYDLLLRQRDQTVSRYRLRDSTAPDVDQTLNRLELAAGRVISARAAVQASAARYRNLVGHYPDELLPVPALPDLPVLETLYTEGEAYSPSLAAFKFAEVQSRAAVAAARAEMMPQVGAYASALRAPITPYQNSYRQEAVSAGVRLTMPLYSGGQMSSALRAAKDRNLADQQFVEQARRDMREQLAADWALLEAAQASLPRFDAAVSAAERAVEGVKRQETAGIRTLRDVLDVTNDLLSARTAAVQARAEAYVLRVDVLRDAGILTIGMFSRERPYDPDSRLRWSGRLAGLPLRPLLEPLDRLASHGSVPVARVQLEYSLNFEGLKEAPLQPVSQGSEAEGQGRGQ
ncbi:outer membrane protein [Novosphingobium sp. PhB57]|uniref:TolC family protein n=1 Tax=Novosphingobium sp. PhB57 TaxID=2485107 RepID=UPI0010456B04|nr:TolC family protein [Novosphingobium sp. PhB57]TCU57328.1 outer membrane protein [Novosphingobium sp. PhB57]